jgi:hypothetical protein
MLLGVAGAAVLVGVGTGTGYALWSSAGAGSGSASTEGGPLPVTVVTAGGAVSSALVPGGTADLLVALDNPNAFPVTITGIQQTGTVTSSAPGCLTTGVTVPTSSALSVSVPTGSDVVVSVPGAAAMSSDSDSACQGATFRIPLSVTVRR